MSETDGDVFLQHGSNRAIFIQSKVNVLSEGFAVQINFNRVMKLYFRKDIRYLFSTFALSSDL